MLAWYQVAVEMIILGEQEGITWLLLQCQEKKGLSSDRDTSHDWV